MNNLWSVHPLIIMAISAVVGGLLVFVIMSICIRYALKDFDKFIKSFWR